jgi:sec-independent protein translocase protein TatA
MQDWMIVLIIGVVVIFGASKLPQIARNMGKAQGEFKKGIREGTDTAEATAEAPPPVAPGTPAASPPVAPPGQHIPPTQPATEQPPADGGSPSA